MEAPVYDFATRTDIPRQVIRHFFRPDVLILLCNSLEPLSSTSLFKIIVPFDMYNMRLENGRQVTETQPLHQDGKPECAEEEEE